MSLHRLVRLIVCTAIFPVAVSFAGSFDDSFDDATLRVDLFQYGDAETEHVALDRLIRQGTWAGPIDDLIDPHPYGAYVARAVDPESGETLFAYRFDSLYGEYRTTSPAARGVVRVYRETVLLPFPKRPIRLIVAGRAASGEEKNLLSTEIDPTSVDIAEEAPRAGVTVVDAHIAGDPHSSLDIAVIGEGYTIDQIERFHFDLGRFSALLLSQEPYASRKDRINIRGVVLPSLEPGCDQPTRGDWRTTSIGASFNSLGSPRYLLTEANGDLRDIAANAPYDTLVIMVNHDRYGGGGIYNRYCTFTTNGAFSGYLLLHEFGHSFGGLADEYYTSSTAYNEFYPSGAEPIQPNITASTDRGNLKWVDLVASDTPIPTDWEKTRFDEDDLAYQVERRQLDASIAQASRAGVFQFELDVLREIAIDHAVDRIGDVDEFMVSSGLTSTVGCFEGAGYVSEGLFRPSIDCLMFSRGVKALCPVCVRAVASRIDYYGGR